MTRVRNVNIAVVNLAGIGILLVLSVYLLIIGRSLLQPLVTAFILWYIMVRLAAFIRQPTKRARAMPQPIALFLSLVFTCGMVYWFFLALGYSINNVVTEASSYQRILNDWVNYINILIYRK